MTNKIPFFFTVSQAKQILSLIDWSKEEGVYSGRRDYWQKRNNAIEKEIRQRLFVRGERIMSRYTVERDITFLTTKEIIEIFQREILRRIYKDKAELKQLNIIVSAVPQLFKEYE